MPTVFGIDPAKAEFLFDRVSDDVDLDDPDQRADLVALDGDGPLSAARSAMRAIVAEQIINDEPPSVWATAQRLWALGMDRGQVMAELAMAFNHAAQAALANGAPDAGLATDAYEAALESLPLPTVAEIEEAVLAVVADGTPMAADDLDSGVLARLGRAATDPLAELMVDRVLDRLMGDDGPIALLAGDQVVDVGALTAAIVLTHRLSHAERDDDVLTLAFELAGFARRAEPHLSDGSPLLVVGNLGIWPGRARPAGCAFTSRASCWPSAPTAAAGVGLDVLAEEPPLEAELIDLVRAAYDDEVAEPWLPVAGEDLILGVLIRNPGAFNRPRPPLVELCAAAGLERRGGYVAHDDSVWEAQRRLWRMHRVFDAFDGLDSDNRGRAALGVLEIAEADDPSAQDLRRVLAEGLTQREQPPAIAPAVADHECLHVAGRHDLPAAGVAALLLTRPGEIAKQGQPVLDRVIDLRSKAKPAGPMLALDLHFAELDDRPPKRLWDRGHPNITSSGGSLGGDVAGHGHVPVDEERLKGRVQPGPLGLGQQPSRRRRDAAPSRAPSWRTMSTAERTEYRAVTKATKSASHDGGSSRREPTPAPKRKGRSSSR